MTSLIGASRFFGATCAPGSLKLTLHLNLKLLACSLAILLITPAMAACSGSSSAPSLAPSQTASAIAAPGSHARHRLDYVACVPSSDPGCDGIGPWGFCRTISDPGCTTYGGDYDAFVNAVYTVYPLVDFPYPQCLLLGITYPFPPGSNCYAGRHYYA